MKITIWDGKRNRMIGDLDNGVFTKRVALSKHLFRALDAWGIDADYFHRILLPMDALIKVYEKEEKKTYTVSAEKFKEFGEFYHFNKDGTGADHRSQIFLSRSFWDIT